MKTAYIILAVLLLASSCNKPALLRTQISLNGEWEITKTESLLNVPSEFNSKAPVPGLVDMSSPKLDNQDTAYTNSIYWYKRNFDLKEINSDVIVLKINKAKYHTRVYVNKEFVGENVYNFTPSLFDIKPFLKKNNQENELIIAVGCKNNLPDTVTHGGDFEKTKYIPGIYDDVKLIVSGYPFISNVQAVPVIKKEQLRVIAEIQTKKKGQKNHISYMVREAVSKKLVNQGTIENSDKEDATIQTVDFTVKLDGCQLWTPETPFLYDLELSTTGDSKTTRFGMRTFSATKDSGFFLLNDKPYYMRGTNVCIFRFFEDPDRNGLPWDSQWVTKLHNRFKEMHWNSIRYCIGFPPERWYEIADSLGFLIQDEYPLWTGGKGGFERLLGGISSKQLAVEYQEWMRERWNHPCVVIWDAQNESVNDTTGKAIQLARSIDLSNRPWDNGWAAPISIRDATESHPYLFTKYRRKEPAIGGYLKELLSDSPSPRQNDPNTHSPLPNGQSYSNPVIVNEYGWLWLNRNGSTTTLTDNIYANVFPQADTPEKRLDVYAKNLGILTEYWRVQRKAGGVLHFCGLGYSRPEEPRGQTSDNFTDIQELTYEPHFYKYLKQAFSPVAIMVNFWEESLNQREQLTIPVHLINDTYDSVKDSVKLSIFHDDEMVISRSLAFALKELQKEVIQFPITVPDKKGQFRMEAEIFYEGESIKSIREFQIK